jgi:DNA mismatch repair protein MutL
VIDKHAAHERIIFNKLCKTKKEDARQVLLTPVQITLSKEEYNVILTQLDTFESCGFLIEDFGNNCVVVRECPMLLHPDDVQDVVLEIAQNLLQHKTDIQAEKINRIYETAACKAAIKAGNRNSTAELKALAEQVLYSGEIRCCPHGRPVLIEMSRYDLEKQFGRIQ